MSGRRQAVLVALLCSIIPFMGWLGVVIMALVTLRKGAFEGFIVLLATTIPSIVMALMGKPLPLFYGVVCGSLVTWMLAIVLRETMSWNVTIQVGALIAIVGVLLAHLIVGDITSYWHTLITAYYSDAEKSLNLAATTKDLQGLINIMSKIATGIQADLLLIVAMVNLGIARWMQAVVFNPGGFAREMYQLRMGLVADLVLVLLLVAALIKVNLAMDLLPILLLVFFVAGLSLVHALAAKTKLMLGLLLIFYALLILFFPYIAAIVVMAAFADSWLNLRQRILKTAS